MFKQCHFQALATMMQETKPYWTEQLTQWEVTRDAMADLFKSNPKFKRARFVQACEPGANVRARTVTRTPQASRGYRNGKAYRLEENMIANPGFYVRPDDLLSFSPSEVYATAREAWNAWEDETR